MIETFAPEPEELAQSEIAGLYNIMIDAYAITEAAIWGENYVRMSEQNYNQFILLNELIVARIDGEYVGSVRVYEEAPKVFNLSVFSVAQEIRGKGVGANLVRAAEKHAKRKGGSKLTLEILRPQLFELPIKSMLTAWYKKLGYNYIESMLFEERKPDNLEKLKHLQVPVIFDCYEKEL